jgi:YgiT-type zinc finger domain-containing protein
MTCLFCKGDMQDALTTHFAQVGQCIVIVKDVPCSECSQCGEVVYSGTILKRLEQIIDEYQKSLTEIAVVIYSATEEVRQ